MFTLRPLTAYCFTCLSLTCSWASAGLIVNGDFEAGNTGFTSSYAYIASGLNTTEGQYTVRSVPGTFNGSFANIFDHTPPNTAGGLMMIVNGATTSNVTLWEQTVSVQSNTLHNFSLWVASAIDSGIAANRPPAVLSISINGTSLGTITAPDPSGVWKQFTATWNSVANSTATIRIVDLSINAFPNDFYVDDIDFTAQSVTAAVPEPASLALWGIGALAIGIFHRRRQ